jgi:L,D-peptidoglycan transpeptidase YkuD (ErfK/YbiS/YcfS/YnhG family)
MLRDGELPDEKLMTVHRRTLALLVFAAALAGTAHAAADAPWQNARQMIVVTTADWHADHGTLRTFERKDGRWQVVNAGAPVTIGKAGAGWGIGLHPPQATGPHKREGDNRSPAGVFRIGEAFGYAAHADTALPYRALGATDWCVDVSRSPQYNRIVDAKLVGAAAVEGATEPMRRDLHFKGDQRYRLGFVIEHNPDARPQAGSCIFAHLWKSPTAATAGCTAMAPALMQSLLAWLKPRDMPVFVLLPRAEYQRLRSSWHLPALPAGEAQ